jgi:hypothetical protein
MSLVKFQKIQAIQEEVWVLEKLSKKKGVVENMNKMKGVTSSFYKNMMQQLEHHVKFLQEHDVTI